MTVGGVQREPPPFKEPRVLSPPQPSHEPRLLATPQWTSRGFNEEACSIQAEHVVTRAFVRKPRRFHPPCLKGR
ncbi:hypothetical protein chiPu_0007928 [Chiloscyllium punctatum]|uniref:Uncharacterized protein n=1 Tax=Chiloscyllium punctatum TaxID=137246 RepID=A0A401SGD9_CHIPU|nr:hypothetical protein [Chiloscyllium punctatum]